jgi:uncharacterized protein YdaU (DUF1376 family)
MGKAPAFQLYAGDFFLDTLEWELEELGLYTRLLFYEWVNGPLPNDPQKLAKISLIRARKLAQLWPKIAPKFIEKDGFYVNLRLEETREKQRQFVTNQRLKGIKSGEKRRTTVEPRFEPEGNRPWLNPSSSSSSSLSVSSKEDMSSGAPDDPKPPQNGHCPHQEIINLYHETLPILPRIRVWGATRQRHLATRWKEDPKRQSLIYWRDLFTYIAKSKFLTGQTQDKNGRPFLASLDWIVQPENFAKIIEGRYE